MSLAYISTSPASVPELYSSIKSTNGCHDAKSRFFGSDAKRGTDDRPQAANYEVLHDSKDKPPCMYEYGADSSSRRKGIIPMNRQKSAVASLPTYRVNTLGLGALGPICARMLPSYQPQTHRMPSPYIYQLCKI